MEWIRDHYARVVPDKADDVVEQFRSGPAVGTPEQVVETLRQLRDEGMTYAICYFAEATLDRSGIELFDREVAPALRG